MNRKTITGIGLVIAMGLSIDMSAQESQSNQYNRKKQAQHLRIAEGVVDGNLTRREATALIKQQRVITKTEKLISADGVITPREKRRLNSLQSKANRSIARQKNDVNVRRG